MKKALMMAHVASMIDLFNMHNIRILQELGYEVEVACNFECGNVTSSQRIIEFRQELQAIGIKAYQIPVPRRITTVKDIFEAYHIVKKLVKENKYEIVHCQSPIGGVIARLACVKRRKFGTKVIYVAHGFHFYKGSSFINWLLFYPIEKFCAKYTDCLITMNQEDYHNAKKKLAKANHIEYIPGVGIDIQKIENLYINKIEKRKEINLPENGTVLVSVGELNQNKNHEVIIRALALINNPDIYYIICGQGPLYQYLKDLCVKLKVESNVRILGYRKDAIEILKISDIFVFPSKREGMSMSLMEAMAARLPVICSRIRGNTDLIKNGEGGYLVKTMDVNAYAKVIRLLICNHNLCMSMSRNNQKIITSFDILTVNEIMRKIYIRL